MLKEHSVSLNKNYVCGTPLDKLKYSITALTIRVAIHNNI